MKQLGKDQRPKGGKICKECQFENGSHSRTCSKRGPFEPSIASEQARIAASGVSNYPPGFNAHLLD